MEDQPLSLPPCACCAPSTPSSTDEKQEQYAGGAAPAVTAAVTAATPNLASEPKENGKKEQCCDVSCLDMAARQECNAQCGYIEPTKEVKDVPVGQKSDRCSNKPRPSGSGKKPCKEHLRAARERYATTLEAIGCICKALLAQNLETCCSFGKNPQERSFATPILRSRSSTSSVCSSKSTGCSKTAGTSCVERRKKTETCRSKTDACVKKEIACCGEVSSSCDANTNLLGDKACTDKTSCCDGTSTASGYRLASSPATLARRCYDGDSCCDKKPVGTNITACNASERSPLDSCCVKAKGGDKGGNDLSIMPASASRDIEKDTVVTEHVTLSVEGLTCVGCENKLFRSLNAIPGIHNLQTSLVMAQADFDVDLDAASVDGLIREVAKSTGFTCQRLRTQGQSVDIIVQGDARDFINQKTPHGVETMVALDKQTVRVMYDAKLVGVRDLLENVLGSTISLAPFRPYKELEAGSKHVRQTAYMTTFSAMLTIPVLVLAWAPIPQHDVLYGSVSLALATIVQIVVARPFYSSACKALLFTRVIEMDFLIVLSTSTAYVFSVIAFAYTIQGRPLSTGEFFETSTLLMTLIMLGRLASAFARQKAVESISVRSLQIGTALLVDGNGLGGQEIDARLLQYGDTFKVLPDSRIPTDGVVISGANAVDESNLTGEAVPVEKSAGSNIIAGCLNGSGTLIVRLRRLPGENTISEIAAMVDQAKFSKPKIQQLADRVASFFVPVVIILTLITFGIWTGVGKAVQHQSIGSAIVQAITYGISVLIVSCPCAIGLAVPMVVVIAGGVGARHGVVFKSAETIEIARKVFHVVFDKTGTLTQGELSVSFQQRFPENFPESLVPSASSLALGLTMNSKHPVSAAVAVYLQAQGVEPVQIEDLRSVTGSGMEGIWEGSKIRGGNSRWLAVQSVPQVATMLAQGLTVFCVSLGLDLVAAYGLNDTLRPDAKSVVLELQKRNIAVSLVSGDDNGAVQSIGLELGIPGTHIRSRCSPKDKRDYIKAIMDDKDRVVLFCGDGTNDAVALAQANIGLHMNSGTDVAQSAADAILMRPALTGILVLIDLSHAAFRRIVFNFSWSFIYNIFAVLLAAGAFVSVRIPPQYAGLGEIVSVLPVILIALQLRWFKTD